MLGVPLLVVLHPVLLFVVRVVFPSQPEQDCEALSDSLPVAVDLVWLPKRAAEPLYLATAAARDAALA